MPGAFILRQAQDECAGGVAGFAGAGGFAGLPGLPARVGLPARAGVAGLPARAGLPDCRRGAGLPDCRVCRAGGVAGPGCRAGLLACLELLLPLGLFILSWSKDEWSGRGCRAAGVVTAGLRRGFGRGCASGGVYAGYYFLGVAG